MRYKLLRVLFNLLFWSYTLVLFTFWLSVASFAWLLALPFDPKRSVFRLILFLWCKSYMTLCPFWRFRIEGRENLPKGTCIFVVNHQSLMDIVVLLSLGRHFKWVAKKELFSRPFVGWLLFFGRDISLDRSSLRDASRMITACLSWLNRGVDILIFPEGHRNVQVGKFKLGAFLVAREARVPLVPIVVTGPAQIVRGYFIEPYRQTVRIQILKPVEALQQEEVELESIAQEVETSVRMVHRANVPEVYR